MGMHHHGADGSCHDGPGGLFGCGICERELDEAIEDEEETVITSTEWRIEGRAEEEDVWHDLGFIHDDQADPLAQRDRAVKLLREHGIRRYDKVRLAKYVTTVEVVGEDITV